MSSSATLDRHQGAAVLSWAVERSVAVTATVQTDGGWRVLKSRILNHDPAQGVVQIVYPTGDHGAPPEIVAGQKVGVAFRRGHKKCMFSSLVVVRRAEIDEDGESCDTLVLRSPDVIREVQRRAYQRIAVPPNLFVAAKLWEGGAPTPDEPSWPVCSGRVTNASVGGILIDIRDDQNPRLGLGDIVGVEITRNPSDPAIVVEAQYRHSTISGKGRLGLGFQFVGLEHDLPNVTPLPALTEFVRELQRESKRYERSHR